MGLQKLTDKIEKHIRSYFKDDPYPELPYHNSNYIDYGAKQVKKLGVNYALNKQQLVVTATGFHTVGYLEMLIMDVHAQGGGVNKKFYYLRWAHNIFMLKLTTGVLAFMIAICIQNPISDIIKF